METTPSITSKVSPAAKNTLLFLSCILYSIGGCGGPLITRLYFIQGGNSLWLASIIQIAGFTFNIVVLIILYFHRRATRKNDNNKTKGTKFIYIRLKIFFAAAFIGIIAGLDSYLYSYGFAHLPVSTSSLIMSSQLGFMAFFAYIFVKQKFTPYSINALVLLTVGAVVLVLHASSDRPKGESNKEYLMAFVMTVLAALLFGLMMPLIELTYNKAKQTITFTFVLEIQTVICLFATLFCLVGMIVNNDFKVIPKEATNFELGQTKYYTILCVGTLIWQCFFLGAMGVIFCASSLMSGIIGTTLLPVTEVLAILFFKEKFQSEKGVAFVLCIWGFVSYFYGEFKVIKKSKNITKSSQHSQNLA